MQKNSRTELVIGYQRSYRWIQLVLKLENHLDMQEVSHGEGDRAAVHGRVVVQRTIVRDVRADGERDRLRLETENETCCDVLTVQSTLADNF